MQPCKQPHRLACIHTHAGSLLNAAVTRWIKRSLLFMCLSHFFGSPKVPANVTGMTDIFGTLIFPPLPVLPLPRLPCLSSPSSPFMSSHFALVNHTRLFSLVSVPTLHLSSSILLCAPQGQGAVRRHQLPLHASLHRHASCLASYSYLSLPACPSP